MTMTRWIALAGLLALLGCRTQPLDDAPAGDAPIDLGAGGDLASTACPPACAAGFFCELAFACGIEAAGACRAIPASCAGANSKQPVCGCDGQTYPNDCLRQQAGVSLLAAGACPPPANACTAAGGYCAEGDFVKPTCKPGYGEATEIEAANPGVCGLGICCGPINN
jgi:Kazal-type serine protease inhibitor domain